MNDAVSLTDIISQAGIGAIALAVGWLLLRRSDNREQTAQQQAHQALSDERDAHERTRQLLYDCLSQRDKETPDD